MTEPDEERDDVVQPRRDVARDALSAADLNEFVGRFDALDVVLRYDVDFDTPLKNRLATGILALSGAMDELESSSMRARAQFVGSWWCEIVRADVGYQLVDGLRAVNVSQAAANQLNALWQQEADGDLDRQTLAYVVARWFDGAGKIRYRLGAFTRARSGFDQAAAIARKARLWWVTPDVTSNFLRAQFEEMRQAVVPQQRARQRLQQLAAKLRRQISVADGVAGRRGILVAGPTPLTERQSLDRRDREFLRGYSSLLHNLSVTTGDLGDLGEARRLSHEAEAISRALGDGYRLGQSLVQQAQLFERSNDIGSALALYREVELGEWVRGRSIAKQNAARLGGAQGAEPLRTLLDEIRRRAASGGNAGTDIDFHAYTIRAYLAAAADAGPGAIASAEAENLGLEMARSVRQVVALPTYKRAYARQVQPTYQSAASRALQEADEALVGKRKVDLYGQALAFAEESSARELLDMISNARARSLEPPENLPEGLSAALAASAVGRRSGARRRSGLRRTAPTVRRGILKVMQRRAQRFEAEFLRAPLDVAPHDEEIAHRVMMFAANNPDTVIFRYFTAENAQGKPIVCALIIHRRSIDSWRGPSLDEVRNLAEGLSIERAPTLAQSMTMWRELLEGPWSTMSSDGGLDARNLVIVPTDDVFALPLHVARPSRDVAPLGARIPLANSVSLTAFVTRGRHMLRRQAVDESDDLAAVVLADEEVSGDELTLSNWDAKHIFIAGDCPIGVQDVPAENIGPGNWEGVGKLVDIKPEFFVYAGHGQYVGAYAELGPFLRLRDNVVTQFDVALRLRLPQNKLAVLGACVAGQGTAAGGGEVAGFLRSLTAAGAGAIALPLWSVRDEAIAYTVGNLLRKSRDVSRAGGAGIFDVVDALHDLYREEHRKRLSPRELAERMPIALYL